MINVWRGELDWRSTGVYDFTRFYNHPLDPLRNVEELQVGCIMVASLKPARSPKLRRLIILDYANALPYKIAGLREARLDVLELVHDCHPCMSMAEDGSLARFETRVVEPNRQATLSVERIMLRCTRMCGQDEVADKLRAACEEKDVRFEYRRGLALLWCSA